METESRLIYVNMLKDALRTDAGAKALGHSIPRLFCVDKIIDSLPTVDAVEVVHGWWIDTGETYEDEKCRYNYWECSECNNQIAGRYGLYYYCPNCGAKMDGDGNG